MKRFLMILLIFLFPFAGHLYGDDTDLFTVRVDPNVLIIIDNSGSMNEVIYHSSYNPQTTYTAVGGYASGTIYYLHNTTYQTISTTINSRAAGLLFGPGDDNNGVRYNGNYLNWIFWYATADERNNLPQKTRIQVAREVLTNLINNTTGVRFGLMRFNFEHGGSLIAECGSLNSTLITAINGMTATTWTPLSETMVEAWQYFSGEKKSYYNDVNYTSPIQYYCQRNFIILVTDGEPTKDRTFPSWVLPAIAGQYDTTPQSGNDYYPYYLDGVAWYLNTFDADSKLVGVQNVSTYPIGFTIAHPLLQRTAEKGGGLYFTADNAAQLTDALEKALKDIGDKSYAFTSPSVPAVRINDTEDNVVYLTSFEPSETPIWKGNVMAYSLKADGTLAVDAQGNPDQSYLLWNAHEKFKTISPDSRKIYTYVGGALNPFTSAKLSKNDLAVSTDDERDKLILHIRGKDSYDLDPKDGNTTNDKRSKLGDIFHSNPVIVGRPSPFFEDEGFNGSGEFYQNNKDRTKVIITGANDGMLHAFNAATGAEEWAFIPNILLTNLKTMVTAHTYYVDSSPKVADVWFGDENVNNKKDPDEWRTVLVCGLRKGGKHYFALDITDTRNPKYLWEFPKPGDAATLANVGQSWSEPAIGRVKIEEGAKVVEKWVAFIGGGFDPSEQKDKDAVIGRAFFVIDIKTGEIIKEFSGYSEMKSGFAAPPTALDTNFDGYVDKVYIGDQGGRMWVFTVTSNKTTEWTGAMLFQAPGSTTEKHPIYYQPAVAFDRYRTPWVYFGTGDRENPTDTSNPAERFYAVKDDGLGNYPRKENTDLEDVTSNNTFVSDQTKKGWFIMLAKGEQVLAKSAVFNQLVYFTTYTYIKSNDPCSVDSIATLYIVEYLSGGGAYLVDEFSDLGPGQTPSHRSEVIGVGVPSAPVISVNMKGEASVIIGTTSGQVFSKETFSKTTNKELLYWREVVR